MKRRHVYLCVLCTMLLAGCAAVNDYIAVARSAGVSESYYAILDRWTRSGTAYSEFETNLRMVATLRSEEFNNAYREEFTRSYEATGQDAPVLKDAMTDLAAGSLEFFVYAYMPDKKSNNLESSRSLWKLFLISDGGVTEAPTGIEELEITPAIEKLFPYVNRYHGKFYRVRFARSVSLGTPSPEETVSEKRETLVCTGILGRVDLGWKMPMH